MTPDPLLEARWRAIAASPQTRFPLLTTRELERLAWFAIYFGEREMADATSRQAAPSPDLAPLFEAITQQMVSARFHLTLAA